MQHMPSRTFGHNPSHLLTARLTANQIQGRSAMPQRQIDITTTPRERISQQARLARADVEKSPPGKARDRLIRKLREIEAAVDRGHPLYAGSHQRK